MGRYVVRNGNVAKMFEDEQESFANLINGFTPEQWELPSLCPQWTVREVVLHTAFHTHRAGLKETLGSTEKYTALLSERAHAETINGLVAWFESPAPANARRLKINVCELVIHQQDVRRTVGSTRDYPEATMLMCLQKCAGVMGNTFIIGRKRRLARGLRLVATDMSWSIGRGPEISGTGEALLMAIAGRSAALADLAGPGLTIMSKRYETDPAPSGRATATPLMQGP